MGIQPELGKRLDAIYKGKIGRKLGLRSRNALAQKVLIAFVVKYDRNYDRYIGRLSEFEKELLSLDEHDIKSATIGDLDRA